MNAVDGLILNFDAFHILTTNVEDTVNFRIKECCGIKMCDSWQRIKKYVGAWLVFHQKSWYDHHVINHHLMVLDELWMDRCRLWYVKFRWT